MTGPVDALAVMDDHIRVHGRNNCPQHARELVEVRNAVAELIEAAINVHAACRAGKEPDLIALADTLDNVGAKAARKASLANVGPQS